MNEMDFPSATWTAARFGQSEAEKERDGRIEGKGACGLASRSKDRHFVLYACIEQGRADGMQSSAPSSARTRGTTPPSSETQQAIDLLVGV